ncbi:MAG: ice-binding family protein [Chloroflexota bacterium]
MHRAPKAFATLLITASLAVFFVAQTALAALAPVGLGTAGAFAVLAGETITNTGPTTITGNVGLHPGSAVTGFASVTLHGTQHVADGVALQAKNDLITAYNNAAGRTPVTTVATELGGQSLKSGVYNSTAGTFGVTGTLTLDAEGNSHAVFIFKMASTLITAPASRVSLVNGAQACNVYWQVGSSATLDTTTSFKGTILALTSIAMKTGATLEGRALARNGEVTLDTNVITRAACTTPSSSDTAMARGGEPMALGLPISLLLIGILALMISGALASVRRLSAPRR